MRFELTVAQSHSLGCILCPVMQIFALETNLQKVKQPFLAPGEREIFMARPHWVSFFIRAFRLLVLSAILGALVVAGYFVGLYSIPVAVGIATALWIFFVFFRLFDAFINWRFDFLLLTSDELIIVDQTSIFRKSIRSVNLESIGDVVAETQWLNLFAFGIIRLTLKEDHTAPPVVLKFMPDAASLVSKIAEYTTIHQREEPIPSSPQQ